MTTTPATATSLAAGRRTVRPRRSPPQAAEEPRDVVAMRSPRATPAPCLGRHFGGVTTGLPPPPTRTRLAVLSRGCTNKGLPASGVTFDPVTITVIVINTSYYRSCLRSAVAALDFAGVPVIGASPVPTRNSKSNGKLEAKPCGPNIVKVLERGWNCIKVPAPFTNFKQRGKLSLPVLVTHVPYNSKSYGYSCS